MVKGTQMGIGRGLLAVLGVALLGLAVLGDDEQVGAAKDAIKPPPDPEPPEPLAERGRPPTDIAWPQGWERWREQPTSYMLKAANAAIASKVPLGTLVPGGTIMPDGVAVQRFEWGVFLEWHYHPPGQGFAAEGWHRGATLVWRPVT